jgi:hypothetical protein
MTCALPRLGTTRPELLISLRSLPILAFLIQNFPENDRRAVQGSWMQARSRSGMNGGMVEMAKVRKGRFKVGRSFRLDKATAAASPKTR